MRAGLRAGCSAHHVSGGYGAASDGDREGGGGGASEGGALLAVGGRSCYLLASLF